MFLQKDLVFAKTSMSIGSVVITFIVIKDTGSGALKGKILFVYGKWKNIKFMLFSSDKVRLSNSKLCPAGLRKGLG